MTPSCKDENLDGAGKEEARTRDASYLEFHGVSGGKYLALTGLLAKKG